MTEPSAYLTRDLLQEYRDNTFIDVDWSSGGSDFESEGLAEGLAERIRLNTTEGWYDS